MNPKNWSPLKWVIIGGVIAVILQVVLMVMLVMLVIPMMKSGDVYKGSFARIQSDPAVIELLGEPINASMFVSGSVKTKTELDLGVSSGEATLSYRVFGPRGSARAHVEATMQNEIWHFRKLFIVTDEWEQPLDLGGFDWPDDKAAPVLDERD